MEEQPTPEQIAQNCIFCQLASGKIPSKVVYEDDICAAILDINPATKGHMLLMPKQHFVLLPQIPDNIVKHLAIVAKKLSYAAIKAIGAEGTNIFVANGAVAGQRAPHTIIHIIPRVEGDGITVFELPTKEIREQDLLQIEHTITERLGIRPKQEPKKKELQEVDLTELEEMVK